MNATKPGMNPGHDATGPDLSSPVWRCDLCHDTLSVRRNDGSIYFSYAERDSYQRAKNWHVVHDRCDPAALERHDVYWIALNRMDSWAKVADWSAHLHGKSWFADTNWGDLLYRAGVGQVAA
jgi:hypothetical protein